MTNSGLGWAAPLKQPEVDKSVDFKQKPYADLTQAMGESIKESIKAQEALTRHLLNNVETDTKRRDENIDFLFNLAPKALGQAVEAGRYIREGEKDWGEYTRNPHLMDEDKIKNAAKRDEVWEAVNKDASIILQQLGDHKGALNFLNVNNRKQRKEILDLYLNTVKANFFAAAETLEFKVDGEIYTLNGANTPPEVKKEIRRRLLVTLATNANRTLDANGKKLFSKSEILNGLIRPISKENDDLFIEETNEAAIQSELDLRYERRSDLVKSINANNLNALEDAFATFQLTNTDSKITLPQFIEATWDDLLKLAERDPNNKGVDLDMLIAIWERPYKWNDGTQYESMEAAFNARFKGKGEAISGALYKLKEAQLTQEDIEFKSQIRGFANKYYPLFQNIQTVEEDKVLLSEATQSINLIKAQFPGLDVEQWLSEDMKNIMNNGGIIQRDESKFDKLIKQYRDTTSAPLLSDLESLHPYWQQEFMSTLGITELTPFDKITTQSIEKYFIDYGILNPNVLDATLAVNGINTIPSSQLYNIKSELLGLVAIEFNKLNPNQFASAPNPKQAMINEAIANVDKDFKELIAKVVIQNPKKEDVNALKIKIENMAKPGFGDQPSVSEMKLLVAQQTKFNNLILKNNDYNRNTQLFFTEDRIIGENHKTLDELNNWVLSGGKSKIPGLYKSWSNASGIPVRQILLQRAFALKNDLLSNDDQEVSKDIQEKYLRNLTEISEEQLSDNAFQQKLGLARTQIEANQILLHPSEDNTSSDALFHPRAITKEKEQDGFSRFNFIQTSGEKTPNNISELTIKELGDLFKNGDYYNIGAYGIVDEATFKKIAISLEAKGKLRKGDYFNAAVQKMFLIEALELNSTKGHQYTGVQFDTTTFSEEDLKTCNLHEQFFPINQKLADYCKANNYK